jgi:hypothetical protein
MRGRVRHGEQTVGATEVPIKIRGSSVNPVYPMADSFPQIQCELSRGDK